jgi:hypothetical protein
MSDRASDALVRFCRSHNDLSISIGS